MNIYLIRHGEAAHNVDMSCMSHTHDSHHALTNRGQRQVRETAQFLSQHLTGTTTLFTSPYRRTMETAEAIHGLLPAGTPIHQNLFLREWELGNLYDVANRPPEFQREWKAAGKLYFRFPNGESLADVYLRATLFLQTKLQPLQQAQNPVDNVVLVTHAAFIHMMLTFLLDWSVDDAANFTSVANASVTAVEERAGGYRHSVLFVPTEVTR